MEETHILKLNKVGVFSVTRKTQRFYVAKHVGLQMPKEF